MLEQKYHTVCLLAFEAPSFAIIFKQSVVESIVFYFSDFLDFSLGGVFADEIWEEILEEIG